MEEKCLKHIGFKHLGVLKCIDWRKFPTFRGTAMPSSSASSGWRKICYFKTSVIICQTGERKFLEDFTLQQHRCKNLQYIIIIVYFQEIGRVISFELQIYLSFCLPTKLLSYGMQISTCFCSRPSSVVFHCHFRFVCLCTECTYSLLNLGFASLVRVLSRTKEVIWINYIIIRAHLKLRSNGGSIVQSHCHLTGRTQM